MAQGLIKINRDNAETSCLSILAGKRNRQKCRPVLIHIVERVDIAHGPDINLGVV